jgi:regulator of replication initiation timing
MTTLTPSQIARAEALRSAGKSLRAIGRLLHVSASTVQKALLQQTDGTTHSTLEKIRLQRLERLVTQNERYRLELEKMKQAWVPRAQFQADVIRANIAVKMQFLALGPRVAPELATMTDARDIGRRLTQEVERICNDLAYGTDGRKEESA